MESIIQKSQESTVRNLKETMLPASGYMTRGITGLKNTALGVLKGVLGAIKSWIIGTPFIFLETKSLDRAALFVELGAKLSEIKDKYPENTFVLAVSPFMLKWERKWGFVRYKSFCEKRKMLKRRGRIQAGLPERFTGSTPLEFKDMVIFRNFTKTELEKM